MDLELDDLWDAEMAAEKARVSPATIRSWVHRGHLPVAERQGRRCLFRPLDVARAEFATRAAARRPNPPRLVVAA